MYWTADMKSNEAMILAVMDKILGIVWKHEKLQDFNRVWAHDLWMPVQHSNQVSNEATYVGSFFQASTQLLKLHP